jgi:hypothetical protein
MNPPVVVWWVWIAVLAVSLGDVLIQGHRFVSLRFAFGALAATGLVYACTLWPMVIADGRGIEVRNPLRRFFVPWIAVRGIFLADSVEVQCARSAPKKDKTVYAWALASPRRSRARAQLRGWQWDQGKRNRPAGYRQLPEPARELAKLTTAEIMARELATMSEEAKFKSVVRDVDLDISTETGPAGAGAGLAGAGPVGAGTVGAGTAGSGVPDVLPAPTAAADPGADVLSATWSWPPLLAFVLPAIGFAICSLVK